MSILFHLAVGRLVQEDGHFAEGKHEIIAHATHPSMQKEESDYAKNSKQIMNAGASKLVPGKRTHLAAADAGAGPYDIHMMADTLGSTVIIYFAMTTTNFGKTHLVTTLLDDFKTRFLTSNGQSEIEKAKAKGNVYKASQPLFNALFTTYGTDKLAVVQGKIDQVAGVMRENIEVALKNTDLASDLEDSSAALEAQANEFNHGAKKVRRMVQCRHYKLMALIGGIVAIVIIIIIIAVAV
jgi:hypothetical protein